MGQSRCPNHRIVALHLSLSLIWYFLAMPVSRRGSGSVTLPSGQTLAIHTRTQDEDILPHATKKSVIFRRYLLITHMTLNIRAGRWPITWGGLRVCEWSQDSTIVRIDLDWRARFTLTPQRMRMIVEAFKEALETGLEQPGQVVVRQAYLRNYQGHGCRPSRDSYAHTSK